VGVGGERHTPTALPPGKIHGTNCTGCWVGPGSLGLLQKVSSAPGFDLQTVQHVAVHYIFCAIPTSHCSYSIIIFNLSTAAFKAYSAIWVRRSNFHHQASPQVSPRESTQRRKVELWARNVREVRLNADLHVKFRDLLHAVKLRHGTDGFNSPLKEGVLRIFSP